MTDTLSDVVGRDAELGAVSTFLDGGFPSALLIEGEAGIGKTTIWRSAVNVARGRGIRVLACRPAESEARLSFSGLSDLLEPVLGDVLETLPSVQRRALEAALLLSDQDGSPPDPRTVSAACLRALRTLAATTPVLVAVDDVQWLDPPTSMVLEFGARRLGPEPVGLLLAERRTADGDAPVGLGRAELAMRRLRLGPLAPTTLRHVLLDRAGLSLSRPALRRVHETSRGNPFYAIELARALESSGGRILPGQPLDVSTTLDAALRQRIEATSPAARDLLCAAASLARPTESLLGDQVALDEALDAGLLERAGPEIRFTHPLLASAAYRSIRAAERRTLHCRLASLVEDHEERARHLALGADGPSVDVADALDDAARRAAARGAPTAAAELMELAVRLTPRSGAEVSVERRFWAAGYHNAAGEWTEAAEILEALVEELPPGNLRAHAFSMLSDTVTDTLATTLGYLERARADVQDDDAEIAQIECYLSQTLATQGRRDEALRHAHAALEAAERSGDETRLAQALAHLLHHETMAASEPTAGLLERVLALEDSTLWPGRLGPDRPRMVLSQRLMHSGRLDEARPLVLRDLDVVLGIQGEVAALPQRLTLAWLECRAGNWQLASQHAALAYELAEQLDHDNFMSASLCAIAAVDAHLGRVEQARDGVARGMAHSERSGDNVACLHLAVLGFLDLSLGDPAAAARVLRTAVAKFDASGVREPAIGQALPNLIEALAALGELDEARRLLAELEDRVRRTGSAWGAATAGRCTGLVLTAEGDLDGARIAYERALGVHDRLPMPFDRARTLLALGVAERRARQRRAARTRLTEAYNVLDRLGASLWAERARTELGRIGGRAPSSDDLTPAERRVAELVAEGRSNKEVAATLVVSVRTVEAALTRVYRKLDVRSRAGLAHRFARMR